MKIKETIRKEILLRLDQIEKEEQVKIFYACESGSRAWGFPSINSDYDIRFIYSRPISWYLSIDEKRDVIEKPINDEIDLNGWDIKKALKLLRKSNPPLIEWLQSPIIYKNNKEKTALLDSIVKEYYSPKASMYHYLGMSQRNFKEHLQGEIVWVKKYLYVLRPILSCRWIEQGKGIVPIKFMTLVKNTNLKISLITAIKELVERKKQGEELRREHSIPEISNFLENEINRFNKVAKGIDIKRGKTEKLDTVFRKIIE